MPDARHFPRPHFDVLMRDSRAPDLPDSHPRRLDQARSQESPPVEDPLEFPTLGDFPEEILDIRPDSPAQACHALGDYRLVQATHLVQRIRETLDEHDPDTAGERAQYQEQLLSGLEALLLDAYLMFGRARQGGEPPRKTPLGSAEPRDTYR
ncbi:hypothetical protein [Pseudomonas tohonis]|uniref:hypothetical protein n=1 Tax=Pseudomonas tohonis TaxID=2725477 RepID=UPI00255B4EC7|nr:hypothetical protein [Pseudomonas tohonis]